MIKNKKPTIKPISLEEQIGSLEYAITHCNKTNTPYEPYVGVRKSIAEAILVTLKRLPKGVD